MDRPVERKKLIHFWPAHNRLKFKTSTFDNITRSSMKNVSVQYKPCIVLTFKSYNARFSQIKNRTYNITVNEASLSWFSPRLCGRTGPHIDAIFVCWGLLLPPLPRWVPFFVDTFWSRLSRLSLACLLKPWTSQYNACCAIFSMFSCVVLILTSTLLLYLPRSASLQSVVGSIQSFR